MLGLLDIDDYSDVVVERDEENGVTYVRDPQVHSDGVYLDEGGHASIPKGRRLTAEEVARLRKEIADATAKALRARANGGVY